MDAFSGVFWILPGLGILALGLAIAFAVVRQRRLSAHERAVSDAKTEALFEGDEGSADPDAADPLPAAHMPDDPEAARVLRRAGTGR